MAEQEDEQQGQQSDPGAAYMAGCSVMLLGFFALVGWVAWLVLR